MIPGFIGSDEVQSKKNMELFMLGRCYEQHLSNHQDISLKCFHTPDKNTIEQGKRFGILVSKFNDVCIKKKTTSTKNSIVEFKTKCNTLKQNKMSETNCNGDIPHLVSGIFYFPRF